MNKTVAVLSTFACLASLALLSTLLQQPTVWGQEANVLDFDPERVERRLDEIERLIDQAESADDDDRARELRREGERLLDQLEAFERAQDEEEEEGEWEDEFEELEHHQRRMELHRIELEIERLRIETEGARQEAAVHWAELAGVDVIKVYALHQLVHSGEPEETAEVLEGILEETDDKHLSRLITIHLASLLRELGRSDETRELLRDVLLGKND